MSQNNQERKLYQVLMHNFLCVKMTRHSQIFFELYQVSILSNYIHIKRLLCKKMDLFFLSSFDMQKFHHLLIF